MQFVSYAQLHQDTVAWEKQLPAFDAVCGVPRSGLIPAAHIALRRNIRCVELGALLDDPNNAITNAYVRKSNPIVRLKKSFGNRLLIVDDATGEDSFTFNKLREALSNTDLQIQYGAVYRAAETSKVDFYYRDIPQPRLFEWNIWRNRKLANVMCDMDGVLCEDWHGPPEMTDDSAFAAHVLTAKPLYLPSWPILAVVTSRLESYRKQTQQWLCKHNVTYAKLIMHPAKTPARRREMRDHADRKATAYLSDPTATLFIESDAQQASKIFKLTGRPVLCTDTMIMSDS